MIIIIGALFRMFSSNTKQEETEESPTNKRQRTAEAQRPTRSPVFEIPQTERPVQPARPIELESRPSEEAIRPSSIEDKRREQLLRLQKSLENNQVEEGMQSDLSEEVGNTQDTRKRRETSVTIEDSLTERGLINSVIMAEVLGAPRALKPYQSVARQRIRQ